MARIFLISAPAIIGIFLGLAVHAANPPQPPDYYLAILKKDSEVQLKEVTAGYKITIIKGFPSPHKVIACEPDFVTLTDVTGINTIRIHKNAVLSITEVKLK